MNAEEITTNANNLFLASEKVIKTNRTKNSTITFKSKRLAEIKRAQDELHNRAWSITPMQPFLLNERGHTRKIIGNTPYDRMILHSYIDYALEPALRRYLIYDNYASQIGKGTNLARERFTASLQRVYRRCGHNRFYVLLIDFSKFYDNIQHDKLIAAILSKTGEDAFHRYMLETILDSMKTDVSYMSDDEYAVCMSSRYSALDHMHEHRGLRFMPKGLQIGNQGSQLFSIFYPTRIDTFFRCVKGIREHGRYMDDTYVVHDDKRFLQSLIDDVKSLCDQMGLFINERKTQIYRIDRGVKYLNRVYTMSEHGIVRERLHRSTVLRERRKIKRLYGLSSCGKSYTDIQNQYQSWMGNFGKLMTHSQRRSMDETYNRLFINQFLKGETA